MTELKRSDGAVVWTASSAEQGALAKALAAAQAKMGDAKKDAVNPHFKNRYATLAAVREAVTKPLAEFGLAVAQTFEPHGSEGVCIVTTLMHEGGGQIVSKLFIPVQKKDAQGFGSAISYGRRYSLAAIVGIAADDDDDGEASVSRGTSGATKAQPSPQSNAQAVSDQCEKMLATLFDRAQSSDDLAEVTQRTSDAVRQGALTDAARARLRKKMGEATKRMAEGDAAVRQ